ncbi:MAG: UbiA family prenyltransferase [Phycisphaerales bacterium]|nr:UbiA family prenyltransferase [Phycisphaerales bacterium]
MSNCRDWFTTLRAANLPTVWSNVLLGAGLVAVEGILVIPLLGVLAGTSCIYLGGMSLNDAIDVNFDRRNASTRPVASGRIGPATAMTAGVLLLLVGWFVITFTAELSAMAMNLSLLLVLLVSLYQWTHRGSAIIAAGLMAGCRMLVPAIAAVMMTGGIPPIVWVAIAGVGCWTIGVTMMGRGERGGERAFQCGWIWLVVAAVAIPLVTAFAPMGDIAGAAAGLLIILVAWIPAAARQLRAGQIGQGVCWAIAGFAVLDSGMLLAAGQPAWASATMVCAAVTLGGQRLGGGS